MAEVQVAPVVDGQDVGGVAGGDGLLAGLEQGRDELGEGDAGVVEEAPGGLGGGEGPGGAGQGMDATGQRGQAVQVLFHEDVVASL